MVSLPVFKREKKMKVGSLVECVKSPRNPYDVVKYPSKGKIYTIRGIHISGGSVYLEEICNLKVSHLTPSKREPGFIFEYFRELQPPMTISVESILECELV